jgi:TusE/DsrC/DsvC family sulfur relay protein
MHAEKLVEVQAEVNPELDEYGLLKDAGQWNEVVARWLAEQNGVGSLTQTHWRFIHALRNYYFKYRIPPAMSLVCKKEGLDAHCVQKLFCTCLNAWRVAGLPDPGEEAKSYLSAM